MLELLQEAYQAYAKFTTGNQFLGAAVAASMIASFTYLLKTIPVKVGSFIWSHITVSITVRYDNVWENREIYTTVANALRKKNVYFSRSFSIKRDDVKDEKIIIPDGDFALVFHKGWPLWFSVQTESGNSNTFKQTMILKTFGFSPNRILEFASEISSTPSVPKIHIGEYSSTPLYPRTIDSVIMESSLKTKIVNNISNWLTQRDWYTLRGIPYKYTMLLHGIPGCGKTSLIRAIAHNFQMSIYMVNVNGVSDTGLIEKIIEMPKRSILVIEDIDCVGINGMDRAGTSSPTINMNSLTLSGLLNALDGIVPLDEKMVIMTTNHIHKLDPALIRSGRCDINVELKPLGNKEVEDFIRLYYNAEVNLEEICIRGSDLQASYFDFKDDLDGFVNNLKNIQYVEI